MTLNNNFDDLDVFDEFEHTVNLQYIVTVMNHNPFEHFYYEKDDGLDLEEYTKLEQDFIDHYYFREIGSETVDRFQFYLERDWKHKIQLFNKRYNVYIQNLNNLDPIHNSGSTSDHIGSGTSKNTFNDTPMSAIGSANYATNVTDNTNQSTATDTNKGFFGTMQVNLLNNHVDLIRDLKQEFIESFNDLFMGVF